MPARSGRPATRPLILTRRPAVLPDPPWRGEQRSEQGLQRRALPCVQGRKQLVLGFPCHRARPQQRPETGGRGRDEIAAAVQRVPAANHLTPALEEIDDVHDVARIDADGLRKVLLGGLAGLLEDAQGRVVLGAQPERAEPAGEAPLGLNAKPREQERRALDLRLGYGAAWLPRGPVLLVASAASPTVATFLQSVFTGAARAEGATLGVEDVVPLPASDSRGSTTFSLVISLSIAGILGSVVIFLLGAHLTPWRRVGMLLLFAALAGLVGALVANVVIGAFPGHLLRVAGVAALFVLAITAPIAAFQSLLGIAGTAVGVVAFMVIGSPASGGTSAPEFLPGFWRGLSQGLPPGAATTAIRDGVYFAGHGSSGALRVLFLYALIGCPWVALLSMRNAAAPGTAH